MASTINASTSGAGGLISTADNSGVLNLQAAGTTIESLSSTGSSITGTLTVSGNATFNGSVSFPNATNVGMTLLGTITPTAVNSISLGSLTLTNYKALFIAWTSMGTSGTGNFCVFISSSNVQTGGGIGLANASSQNGTAWIDLSTGCIGGGSYGGSIATNPTANVVGGVTNVSTSTTTIYFRQNVSNTFTATGSINIYGVK